MGSAARNHGEQLELEKAAGSTISGCCPPDASRRTRSLAWRHAATWRELEMLRRRPRRMTVLPPGGSGGCGGCGAGMGGGQGGHARLDDAGRGSGAAPRSPSSLAPEVSTDHRSVTAALSWPHTTKAAPSVNTDDLSRSPCLRASAITDRHARSRADPADQPSTSRERGSADRLGRPGRDAEAQLPKRGRVGATALPGLLPRRGFFCFEPLGTTKASRAGRRAV